MQKKRKKSKCLKNQKKLVEISDWSDAKHFNGIKELKIKPWLIPDKSNLMNNIFLIYHIQQQKKK